MADVLVIVPTHSQAQTLVQSLKSIQQQSHESFEVQVIADGASPEVIEVAKSFLSDDKRFNLQEHPKSMRKGEEYRHNSIVSSTAQFITYLADDDIMLPNHIEYMLKNLKDKDFANPRPTFINRINKLWCIPTDISVKTSRDWHLSEKLQNSISLSGVMHTKSSYLKLDEGWVSTPIDFPWTDLYMWRKFLQREDFHLITTSRSTILKFLDNYNLYDEEKIKQNQIWFEQMMESGWIEKWNKKVEQVHLLAGADAYARLFFEREQFTLERDKFVQSLSQVFGSRTWRFLRGYRYIRSLRSNNIFSKIWSLFHRKPFDDMG